MKKIVTITRMDDRHRITISKTLFDALKLTEFSRISFWKKGENEIVVKKE